MSPRRKLFAAIAATLAIAAGIASCASQRTLPATAGYGPTPTLPAPNEQMIPTIRVAPAVGWSEGATPVAAADLTVAAFATGLDHPRWLYVLPNGDVLVAESNAPARPEEEQGFRAWFMQRAMKKAGAAVPSADRITLLRDADHDGIAETRTVLLAQLHSPFGMALVGDHLYVANTDAIVRFPYRDGETRITAAAERVHALPAGPRNHHWTKNILASPDGKVLYATVGSNSNVGENGIDAEVDRAAIHALDLATGRMRNFASGLRNPNGLAWEPETGVLWTAVNERDEIGDDLVPDYMTSVREGDFFGWPYSYYGSHVDARVEPPNPALVATARVPDYALGAHTASLGLAFAAGEAMPAAYRHGAFIGQHGSWNRKPPSGYKVVYVPFAAGQPAGDARDVLTGFLDADGKARGRPVGVAIDATGALLVADDVGNAIWRVRARDGAIP